MREIHGLFAVAASLAYKSLLQQEWLMRGGGIHPRTIRWCHEDWHFEWTRGQDLHINGQIRSTCKHQNHKIWEKYQGVFFEEQHREICTSLHSLLWRSVNHKTWIINNAPVSFFTGRSWIPLLRCSFCSSGVPALANSNTLVNRNQ